MLTLSPISAKACILRSLPSVSIILTLYFSSYGNCVCSELSYFFVVDHMPGHPSCHHCRCTILPCLVDSGYGSF